MNQLNKNFPSNNDVIQLCCDGIKRNTSLKQRLEDAKPIMSKLFLDYSNKANLQELYSLQEYIKGKNKDPKVISELLHSELTYIYTNFFAKSGKPARQVYDKIMNNANGKCPYCGIGSPMELDHYLPKSRFPQFSIFPLNLVPSCERCNKSGKASSFAKNKNEQVLHPYLDNDFYYNECWISAVVESNGIEDIVINYYIKPPISWDKVYKDRVETHFITFNLKERYSVLAGEELSTLIPQILSMKNREYSVHDICEVLLDPVIDSLNFSKNHWKRIMYIAIKEFIESDSNNQIQEKFDRLRISHLPCIKCNETGNLLIKGKCDICEGKGFIQRNELDNSILDTKAHCLYCEPTRLDCPYCKGSHILEIREAYMIDGYL